MLFLKLPTAFAILVLSLLSSVALAETSAQTPSAAEPVYQVEFIVLRPYQRNQLNKETWSRTQPNTPYPLAIAPASSDIECSDSEQAITRLKGFRWATEGQWNLPYTIKRINRGGEYEILLHKAWRQTATTRDQLVPLNVALPFDANNQVISEQQLAYQANSQPIKNGLFGNFAFSKGRYLHLTMDLVLAEAQAQVAAATEQYGFSQPESSEGDAAGFSFGLDKPEATIEYYRLNETRRIKTDETHYFDHPAFSVLAYVSRIEAIAPKQDTVEPTQSEPPATD